MSELERLVQTTPAAVASGISTRLPRITSYNVCYTKLLRVVDVEFPRGSMPKVYDALMIDEVGLTLEVQQQLGDGVVRTIAMGSTDGLKRGVDVVSTGAPISIPVGQGTLGRIMDVLGKSYNFV